MTKRQEFEWHLDCGSMKPRSATILAELANGRTIILSVLATFKIGNEPKVIDVLPMLTLETIDDMRSFIWEKYFKFEGVSDANEPWDGPSGAA